MINPFNNALLFGLHVETCKDCRKLWEKTIKMIAEIGEHIENDR